MKIFLRLFIGLVVMLFLAAILVPVFFKEEVKEGIISEINNNVNAEVSIEDFSLGLLSSFPNLNASLNNLVIVNKAPFEGDTLLSAEDINVDIDLFSAISGDKIVINSMELVKPKVIAFILEDGTTNYDIAIENKGEDVDNITKGGAASNKSSNFNIKLTSYKITNGKIAFVDQVSKVFVVINNINHEGSGDFTQDNFVLDTKTTIDELTTEFEDIKYLNKVKLNAEAKLNIDLPNSTFTFDDNEVELNNLKLNFNGMVAMPNDDIEMDLSFSSPSSKFKDIISMIPAIYKNNFADLEASGQMNLNGKVTGKLTENLIPKFDINLKVENGNFKYPDLPTPINNFNLSMNIINKDGKSNSTIADIRKFHFEIDNEPVDGKILIKNPEKGPVINGNLTGKIDLANLKKSIPLENIEELKGIIKSDLRFKGNLAKAETDYTAMDTRGNMSLTNLVYKTSDFPEAINIKQADLKFNPKNVSLNKFMANIGESDIQAYGYLNNVIPFVLSDSKLIGQLTIESNYFDFNPYITNENESGNKAEKESGSIEKVSFNVPNNIEFEMQSEFKELIYDNLNLKNVTGKIIVKDSRINLSGLNMKMLNGKLSGSGYYAKSENQEKPEVQFNLNVSNFDIAETYQKFISVKQFTPIAKYARGKFSTNLKMKTSLDDSMMPIWETFFSNGLLNLATAEINGFKPLELVSSALNIKELANPKLTNVKPRYEIKNGRFYLKPLKFNIAGYNINLVGSNGIDQSIDYNMEIEIPAQKLKQQANAKINSLFGNKKDLLKSSTIKVNAKITGSVENPKVATSAGDVVSNIVEDVKDEVVSQVKAKVDSTKIKAEKKLKDEAKKKEKELKKKLEDEAKKKLKKLFKWG